LRWLNGAQNVCAVGRWQHKHVYDYCSERGLATVLDCNSVGALFQRCHRAMLSFPVCVTHWRWRISLHQSFSLRGNILVSTG